MIYQKYNVSSASINSLYINKGNQFIVKLCISIIIYLMEFINQTVTENKDGFLTNQEFESSQHLIYGSVRSVVAQYRKDFRWSQAERL